jgi:hypothetical protein
MSMVLSWIQPFNKSPATTAEVAAQLRHAFRIAHTMRETKWQAEAE